VSVLDVGAPRDDAPDAIAVTGHEWPVTDPPRRETGVAKADDAAAVRDAVLWQRRVRLLAAVAILVAASVSRAATVHGLRPAGAWISLVILGLLYGGWTLVIGWFVESASAETVPPGLPAVVLAGDLVAAVGAVYLGAQPADYPRMLMLALLAVQLMVLQVERRVVLAAYASVAVAYLVAALVVPPVVPGPPQPVAGILIDAAVFLGTGVVLLAAYGDFRVRLDAIRRFCRDVEVGELGGTLESVVERRSDHLTLVARSVDDMRQRLIELIGTDPLTGCLNRRALETRLAREWRQARRRGTSLAVLAIDIDRFKPINDSYGHPFGDIVLQQVADILAGTVRETDAVARPGGDEFLVILPDTGWQGATTFAERLRRNVDDHRFGAEPATLAVTISVGVAVARGSEGAPPGTATGAPRLGPAELLEEADRSLYRAKSAGRNRISA